MHMYVFQDSRPEEEYNVSHISGAKRVSPDTTDVNDTMQHILQKAAHGKVIFNAIKDEQKFI